MKFTKKVFGVPSLMVLATVTAFGSTRHPLTITSPSTLPSGVVSTFYSTYLTATGGTAPYKWTWITCSGACNTGLGFDATLSNNSTDGKLNGTPVNAGTSIFGFRVTDANGRTATANLGITILSAPPTTPPTPPTPPPPPTTTPLAITSSGTLPGGVASTSYNTSLTATGGTTPYNWAIQSCSGVCNAGLSLSPAGVFSGTPINSGTSTYSVGVIDATGQSASASLNLTIAAATPSSSTANYFVSPSGSDSNPCSQTSPCATPDYVVNNKAAAGDTVQVAAGTYNYGSEVHFSGSGSAGKNITLTCATRGACKIQNSVTGNSTVIWVQGNFVTIDGFEITNTSSAGNNLGVYVTGNNVSLTRNTIHGIEPDCSSSGGGGIDIATGGGSGDVIDSNLVYDIGWANSSCSGKNTVHGINFEPNAAATVTITNNIVYHTLGGWAIQFQGASVGTTGSVIANNLFFSNGNGGILFNEVGGTLDYNTVVNNTMLVNGTDQAKCGIYEYSVSGTHNLYMNNDEYGNAGGDYCFSTGSQSAGISVDPASGTTFANWKADGSGDYHQKAGSPTINNGTSSTGAPTKDFDGNPRPQGAAYDIGAYESPY